MSVAPTLPFLNTDEPEAWEDHLPENGLWRPQKDWWGGGASEGMTELSTHSGLLFWIAESSQKGNSSGSCSDTSLCSH